MPYPYPWSVLGIAPTNSEREIKIAYAKRLKVVRPDEDAKAFQQLVEARDLALAQARRGVAVIVEDWGSDDDAANIVEESEETFIHTVLSDPEPEPEADKPKQAEEPTDETPSFQEVQFEQRPEPQRTLTPRQILDKSMVAIMLGLSKSATPGEIKTAIVAVATLGELSMHFRAEVEPECLVGVARRLPVLSGLLLRTNGSGFWEKMEKYWYDPEPEFLLAKAQIELVFALREEFGWAQSDRRIYQILGNKADSAVISYLNAFARAEEASRAAHEPHGQDKSAIIHDQDGKAYFGSQYDYYQKIILSRRASGRWPLKWKSRRFFLLPFYALFRFHWELLALWLACCYCAIATYQAVTSGVATRGMYALNISAWMILLCLHLWAGAYSYRLDLRRVLQCVRRADRKGIFDPAIRKNFLHSKSGQDFVNAAHPYVWIVEYKFFYVIILVVVWLLLFGVKSKKADHPETPPPMHISQDVVKQQNCEPPRVCRRPGSPRRQEP